MQFYTGNPLRVLEAQHQSCGVRGQRQAGVMTPGHRDPGRLRGARQYQPACTRAGSNDSIMAPKQGTPPLEAARPLPGDQRVCGRGAVGHMSGQRSEGAASTGNE